MKHLTYGQRLQFQHEYWSYLSSEKCDCDEARHIACHSGMLKELAALDDWKVGSEWRLEKVVERMRAFSLFTKSPEMKAYAQKVIERIHLIETHRMDASIPVEPKRPKALRLA